MKVLPGTMVATSTSLQPFCLSMQAGIFEVDLHNAVMLLGLTLPNLVVAEVSTIVVPIGCIHPAPQLAIIQISILNLDLQTAIQGFSK